MEWPCELNKNKKRYLWSTSCFLLCPEGVLKPAHVFLQLYLPFIFFVLLPYTFLHPVQEDKVLIRHCFHAEKRTLYSACVLLFYRKQDSGSFHPNHLGALLDRLICSCRSFQILSRAGWNTEICFLLGWHIYVLVDAYLQLSCFHVVPFCLFFNSTQGRRIRLSSPLNLYSAAVSSV